MRTRCMAAMNSAAAGAGVATGAEVAAGAGFAAGAGGATVTARAPRHALASATMSMRRRMLDGATRPAFGLLRTDLGEFQFLAAAQSRPIAAQAVAIGRVDL